MQRGAPLAPPTGTPASWETAVAQRRKDFADQMAARMHGSGRNAISTPSTTSTPRGGAFTRQVYDAARRAGIPETQARLAAAQAAHESGWGKRAPGYNYFGIKGSGTAGSQMLRTHEQGRRGLYATTGKFARYARPEDSLAHWWAKIQRQWPEAARAQTFEEAVRGLRAGQRGGYATDRKYAGKIGRIAAGIRPSIGASPSTVAGGTTPHGSTPTTSTVNR